MGGKQSKSPKAKDTKGGGGGDGSPAKQRAKARRAQDKEQSSINNQKRRIDDSTSNTTTANTANTANNTSKRTSSLGQKTAPPPPPRRQVMNEKDREREQNRLEHQQKMELALKGEYQKAEHVEAALAQKKQEDEQARQKQIEQELADLKLKHENLTLKAEVELLKQQRKEDMERQRNAPPAVDEESLAEKIRAMLLTDMEQQSKNMMEAHTEELRMSLLSKVKFEAVQAVEQQEEATAAEAAATAAKKEKRKNSPKSKKGKRRSRSRGGSRKGKKGKRNRQQQQQEKEYTNEMYDDEATFYEGQQSQYQQHDKGEGKARGRGRRRPRRESGSDDEHESSSAKRKPPKPTLHPPGAPSPLEAPAGFGNRRAQRNSRNSRLLAPLGHNEGDHSDSDVQEEDHATKETEKEEEEEEEEEEEVPLPSLEEMDESTAKLLRQSYDLINEDTTTTAKAGNGYLTQLHKMGGVWRKGETKEKDVEELQLNGDGEEGGEGGEGGEGEGKGRKKKKRLKKKRKKKNKARNEGLQDVTDQPEEEYEPLEGTNRLNNDTIENPEDLESLSEDTLNTTLNTTGTTAGTTTLTSLTTNPNHRSTAIHGYLPDGTVEPKVPSQEAGQKAQVPNEFLPGPILRNDPTVKLGKREWENEVARNILVLYKANMDSIRKAEAEKLAAETMSASDLIADDPSTPTDSPNGTPTGTPNSSPTKRKRKKSKSNKLPPISGNKKGKGGRTDNPSDQPSRMMKIGVNLGPGKTVKQHSPHQIWYAGSGNVRAVWDGLVVADEEEAEKAMRKLTR